MSRIDQLREELGGAHPVAATKVKDHLEPIVRGFIEAAPFLVMASSSGDGDCDASPKGGKPGFVKVLGERTLLVPDIGGNRLFQGYQNFETNPKVGLVFMIPGMNVTARVNGRVDVLDRDAVESLVGSPEVCFTDDNTRLIQAIRVSIDEAYLHCPRAFQFAALWDADTIAANSTRSLKSLRT
jgi:predicted pyridoxine 5'-phosphate oxidase superfamily flavin-nucleotide-binding protein